MRFSQQKKKIIVHVDADAFFVSCEQLLRPELCGKLVVTGGERGIASAMSYEAKSLGVVRGMSISQVKRIAPECVVLSSHFSLYTDISKRMVEIMHRYTDNVERYSIDECFADITDGCFGGDIPLEDIAIKLKNNLDVELGIPFSVGISSSKVLAKIASTSSKPSGSLVLTDILREEVLALLPIEDVWGVGRNTATHFHSLGIRSAYSFCKQEEFWVCKNFTKPFQEIWYELQGVSVRTVNTDTVSVRSSLTRSKTFFPHSNERDFIYAQLMRNLDAAFSSSRRYALTTRSITISLRHHDMVSDSIEVSLTQYVDTPLSCMKDVRSAFISLFDSENSYRATGVVLKNLIQSVQTLTLSDESKLDEKICSAYEAIDRLSEKFGRNSVYLGASAQVIHPQLGNTKETPQKKASLFIQGTI